MLINIFLQSFSESNTDGLKNETKMLHELITQRVMKDAGVYYCLYNWFNFLGLCAKIDLLNQYIINLITKVTILFVSMRIQ